MVTIKFFFKNPQNYGSQSRLTSSVFISFDSIKNIIQQLPSTTSLLGAVSILIALLHCPHKT